MVKELKSLLRDRYILFSVILAPFIALTIMGLIALLAFGGIAQQFEETGAGGLPPGTLVCLEDSGDALAKRFADLLGAEVADCDASGYRVLIVVHKGFGKALETGSPASVTLKIVADNPLSITFYMLAESASIEVNRAASLLLAEVYGINATLIAQPIAVSQEMILGDKVFSIEAQVALLNIYLGVLVVALALTVTSVQVGALSVGIEREARTIESLLVLPVPRWHVVVSKAGGVVAVSLLSIASLTVGLLVYMLGFAQALSVSIAGAETSLGELIAASLSQLGVGASGIALAAFSLVLVTVIGSLVGVILGVLFAGDIRGALTTGSYVALVMIAPLFPLLLGFEPSAVLEAVFALSPIYLPARAAMLALSGSVSKALVYVAFSLVYTVIIAALAAASFRPAIVIGGARGLLYALLHRGR
ncbi:MAG: ABC transporter permease [Acidilobaceae archaeon]